MEHPISVFFPRYFLDLWNNDSSVLSYTYLCICAAPFVMHNSYWLEGPLCRLVLALKIFCLFYRVTPIRRRWYPCDGMYCPYSPSLHLYILYGMAYSLIDMTCRVCLREEPVIYINGRPFVLRDLSRPYENLQYTGNGSIYRTTSSEHSHAFILQGLIRDVLRQWRNHWKMILFLKLPNTTAKFCCMCLSTVYTIWCVQISFYVL